jgi:site-specific recombinase XerD
MLEQRLSSVAKGPLFVLENGTVLTSSHVGRFLLTRANRLPIAKFSSHDLRRSFSTALVEMGVALDLVAAIIGHEPNSRDSRTLIKHYVRTDMLERKAHALKAWDERLKAIVTGEDVAKVVQLNRAG